MRENPKLPKSGEYLFARPDLSALRAVYSCFDLHIHSTYSDGAATPAEICERANQLGIAIAITDHNEIRGSLEAIKLGRCTVLAGIEVSSMQGKDVLVYFQDPAQLEEFYRKSVEHSKGTNPNSFTTLPVIEVLESAREHGGLSVLAHPFGWLWKSYDSVLRHSEETLYSLSDGVECCNGSIAKWRNRKGHRLARSWGHAVVGGSDAHIYKTIGDVVTCVEPKFEKDPLAAIRQKRSAVVGTRSLFLQRMHTNISVSLYHLQFWPRVIRHGIWGNDGPSISQLFQR